ncbi:MAG: gliding motility-associated C-terminal domain-containing protein [Saprospiraceae bacterium]
MIRALNILFLHLVAFATFAQPGPCVGDPAMTSDCPSACVICDIDGFTGRNDLTVQGQTFPNFCTTQFHNMSYIAFIAGSEDIEIEVTVDNCTINWGLEIGFFETTDCETFTAVTDCNTDVMPNTTVSFSNDVPLTIGGTYYLIMDGSNSDICDWTFNVISGTTAVPPIDDTGEITVDKETTCTQLPATFSVSDTPAATIFYWTVNGEIHPDINQTTPITFPADGIYEVCVSAANACDEAAPNCITYQVHTPQPLFLNEVLCDNDCLEVADTLLCDSGEYEFTITFDNGCDSNIFVILEILPQAQAFIDINLCAEDSFYIGTTPYFETGFFEDTISTFQDCDSIVMLDLFIVECNIEAATDYIEPVCTGDDNGFLVFSVENGTPPFTYTWKHITDPTISGNGSTNLFENNTISGVPAGDYVIDIFDTFGNTTVEFQSVFDPPILSVTVDPIAIDQYNLSCFGGEDGSILGFPTGGNPPYLYNWSTGGTNDNVTNLTVGNYSLSVTDDNGCEVFTSTTLTEPPVIQPYVNFIDPNCDGFQTGILTLDSIEGGTPPYEYAIDNDTFSLFQTYDSIGPGFHTFYVIDDNDCLVDTTAELFPPDIPQILFSGDLETPLGCAITIPTQTNNTTLTNIQWISNSEIDCDTCLRPSVRPVEHAEYILTLTSIDDCTDTDTINVQVQKIRDIYFPNAFSPNGDGNNDTYEVGIGKSVDQVNYFRIFSRWGEQVYEANNMQISDQRIGWDGQLEGKDMGSGTYTWIAEVTYLDGYILSFRGEINLLR